MFYSLIVQVFVFNFHNFLSVFIMLLYNHSTFISDLIEIRSSYMIYLYLRTMFLKYLSLLN